YGGKGRSEEDHLHRERARDDVDQHDATERIDVERVHAHEPGKPRVEEAVLGIEEEDPAERYREGWEEEGGPEGKLEPVTAGQVRTGEEPGEEHGQGQREELAHE